jgi:hypothetical protein
MPRITGMRFALVVLLVAPIAAAQIIGDAHPVSEMRTDEPMKFSGWIFAANDNGGYAIWEDSGTVQAMQFAANGEPRPETRAMLSTPDMPAVPNDVIAANGAFYAVWSETPKQGPSVARIRRSDGTAEATFSKSDSGARLVWNGSRFLLLAGYRTVSAIILDAGLLAITSQFPVPYAWSVAPASDGFLFVGPQSGKVQIVRVGNDGTVTYVPTKVETSYYSIGFLGWSGSDYVLLLEYSAFAGASAVHLDASGSVVGDVINIDPSARDARIIWDGAAFLVAWPERESNPCVVHLVGRRITADGIEPRQVIDPMGGRLIAAGGTPFIVDDGCSTDGIVGHRLGDPQRHQMSTGVLPQNPLGIASDGAEVAVLWSERNRLLVGRASIDGRPLDGLGKFVTPTELQPPTNPQIVFGGVDYLIVWNEGDRIMARLFSRDGTFRGEPFAVSMTATGNDPGVAVAWTGTEFLVVWGGSTPGAMAITPTGVTTPIDLFPPGEPVDGQPSIATGDRGTLVVYAKSGPGWNTFIKTVLLQGHSVVSRTTVDESLSPAPSSTVDRLSTPHVASDGKTFLVGWTADRIWDSRAWIAQLDEAGARITPLFYVAYEITVLKLPVPYPIAEAHPLFDGRHYHVYASGHDGLRGGVLPTGAFSCHCPLDLSPAPCFSYAARAGIGQLVFTASVAVPNPVGAPRARAGFRLVDFTNQDQPRRRAVR